jgi:diguanylate cyclase (GGDEF)-like protein
MAQARLNFIKAAIHHPSKAFNGLRILNIYNLEARNEYLVRVILGMITGSTALSLLAIYISWLAGWVDDSGFPVAIPILVVSGASWLISRKGGWRWVQWVPATIFFFVGVYGSYYNGHVTALSVFYVISFIINGLLNGRSGILFVVLLSLVTHFGFALIIHQTPFKTVLPVMITMTMAFFGIALLQCLANTLIANLLEKSMIDVLTGAYNRSYYEAEIARLMQPRYQGEYPVSIVAADLNDLKGVNDRYGHSAGDELIVRFVKVMKAAFRDEDMVCRIGGDEFSVLLARVNEATAEKAVARLNQLIDAENQTGPEIPLSLAIGAATACESSVLRDAISLADSRMYAHKLTSKNGRI